MNAKTQAGRPLWFTPSLAMASAMILLAAGILVSFYQDRIVRAQQFREMTVQGHILAASVTAALDFGDVRAVQEYVGAFKINPEIEAAGVYDAKQMLVASFSRAGEQLLPQSARDRSAFFVSGRTIVVVPVTHKGANLGTVYVRAVNEPADQRLARYVAIMLLAVMAALLVIVMGTAQRTLSKANRELEDRAVALVDANRLLQSEMEEREKTEEALRQSQKMEAVGQLSGGIAHDFNNLMTIIQGNLHLLQKRHSEGRSDIQRYIDSANEALGRAANLTRRLLAFSRRQPLSPKRVDLNELATGVRDLVVHSVGDRVQIDWKLSASWKTICDVNQMENVILNLAINARDAMPDGGTLAIETSDVHLDSQGALAGGTEAGDYVEMRVRDTGTGMTEEVRKRAVDPFFTTKPGGQGTGLGLSTAFAFIRQSNGSMDIESAAGKGTTIVIRLPRDPGQESQEAA